MHPGAAPVAELDAGEPEKVSAERLCSPIPCPGAGQVLQAFGRTGQRVLELRVHLRDLARRWSHLEHLGGEPPSLEARALRTRAPLLETTCSRLLVGHPWG